MGMFSSLFGSSGSDKADKMRQSALDAFNNIKTPELSALQVQLNDYVNAGKITPEQAEASLLKSNAFNDIATDPENTAAQKQALTYLQQVGTQGGMTAIDKAQLQDITNQQNQEAKSRNASIMQNAQERGVGNSNLTAVNQLMNEQAAADRASQAGTNVAANAQLRALQAMQSAGQLGGQMEAQQYGEQANKANAANAIEQFNTQTQNSMNLENIRAKNAAEAANMANAQNVANMNTQNQNQNKLYNAQQNQTVFNDALQKASGTAGTFNNWANDATAQKRAETGADLSLLSGAIGAGAKAAGPMFGGPAGAATAATPSYETGFDPSTMSTNPYKSAKINPNTYFAEGGEVHSNDSLQITPKDVEDFQSFIKDFKPTSMSHGGEACMDDGGIVEVSTTTAKVPEVTKKEEKNILERMADLLGSNADMVNEIDKNQGGEIDYRKGGKVPGMANVPGDSPMNDVVPAKLSPGEVVLPRTVVQNPHEIPAFVEKATQPDHKRAALKSLMENKKGKVR